MKSFRDLKNILNAIEKAYENIRNKVDESLLIDEVIDLLDSPRFSSNSKIAFISEQLSLSILKAFADTVLSIHAGSRCDRAKKRLLPYIGILDSQGL